MEEEKSMTTREDILSKLKNNTEKLLKTENDNFELPDLTLLEVTEYENPVGKFIESAQKVSGAKVVEMKTGDDINEIIKSLYPEAKIIASSLPSVNSKLDPDNVEKGSDLMKVDVGVVEGKIGVAENGCIWIPQTMKERAILFASEYLIILLSKKYIVNNMHEAYKIIEDTPNFFEKFKFGTFISGPSKTADIESALVYGAQAARGVAVVIV